MSEAPFGAELTPAIDTPCAWPSCSVVLPIDKLILIPNIDPSRPNRQVCPTCYEYYKHKPGTVSCSKWICNLYIQLLLSTKTNVICSPPSGQLQVTQKQLVDPQMVQAGVNKAQQNGMIITFSLVCSYLS